MILEPGLVRFPAGPPAWLPPPPRPFGPEWGDEPYSWDIPGLHRRVRRELPVWTPLYRLAWGFVQSTQPAATNGVGTTHTVTLTVTAGNRLVISAENNEDTGTGAGGQINMSKTAGTATIGTLRQVVQTANLAAGTFSCLGAVWTVPITGSGTCTISITGANAAHTWQISSVMSEYSGLDPTDALSCVDTSAVSAWNPGTFQAVSATTTGVNELVYGAYFSDGAVNTITAGGTFTLDGYTGSSNISECAGERKDSGGTLAAQTVTWTGATNADISCAVVVFKLPAAAAPSFIPNSGRRAIRSPAVERRPQSVIKLPPAMLPQASSRRVTPPIAARARIQPVPAPITVTPAPPNFVAARSRSSAWRSIERVPLGRGNSPPWFQAVAPPPSTISPAAPLVGRRVRGYRWWYWAAQRLEQVMTDAEIARRSAGTGNAVHDEALRIALRGRLPISTR